MLISLDEDLKLHTFNTAFNRLVQYDHSYTATHFSKARDGCRNIFVGAVQCSKPINEGITTNKWTADCIWYMNTSQEPVFSLQPSFWLCRWTHLSVCVYLQNFQGSLYEVGGNNVLVSICNQLYLILDLVAGTFFN